MYSYIHRVRTVERSYSTSGSVSILYQSGHFLSTAPQLPSFPIKFLVQYSI